MKHQIYFKDKANNKNLKNIWVENIILYLYIYKVE